MATITKSMNQTEAADLSLSGRYNKFIEDLKFSHFGLISMTILIGSICGGIAAMFVFGNGAPFWQFVIGLGFSMANLVVAIAQAPTKWVVNFFALSLIVNTILVIVNLF